MTRMEDGGRAWFVRCGPWYQFQLKPASPAGWLLTLLYVLAAIGISLFFFADDEARPAELIGWGVLMAAGTLLYFVIALRMSAAQAPQPRRARGRLSRGEK